ncbi:conjugal transfer protein MobA [Dysgonomonas sp. ZJ709]|uniref:conjugal transfer protein MobA n=1 Tax=Dysgonomonas sp. ZJ709 TaxID=2709797 RepID=UPI0013ECED4F|nr:conjugal transfer protein MobA [Dysgonomonas sp. ZJ709]
MSKENEGKKRKKGGRKPENNPKIFRYSVNFDEVENLKFQTLLRKSDSKNISRFIASVLLGKEIKVVKIDKVAKDYYMRLTNLYEQYRAIGVNYNQTVKAIRANFAEKRALAMLYRLEKATIELIGVTKESVELTKEYERKWLQK